MIYLRAHHLLCLLTYIGKGYTPAFVRNYDEIAHRLDAGEAIEITSEPDDICAPIACDLAEHCHGVSVRNRDALAARDVGALLGMEIVPGTTLTLTTERLAQMRAAFAEGAIRNACVGCEWNELCTHEAKGGYPHVRVRPASRHLRCGAP